MNTTSRSKRQAWRDVDVSTDDVTRHSRRDVVTDDVTFNVRRDVLSELPTEVARYVISYVDFNDILSARLVSHLSVW